MTALLGRQFKPSEEDFALCSGDRYYNSRTSRGGVLVRQALVLQQSYNDSVAAKTATAKTTLASGASAGGLVLPEA